MEYLQGNAVTLFEQFLDADQQPADPTTVTFYVRDPAGAVLSYVMGVDVNVTNPSVGYYECELGAPTMAGEWHWRVTGSGALIAANEYEFTIIASSTLSPVSDGPQFGPFTAWCDPQDVIEICPGAVGSDTGILEKWCDMASQVMFEKSGRQFAGLSQVVSPPYRPTAERCGCWPWNEQWHSWGQVQWGYWSWDYGVGRWGCDNTQVGCDPISQVKLGGYPVRDIVQVKVGGVVVDPSLYRLDGNRYLVRLRDPASPDVSQWWPSCQIMDLPDTEPGTFSIAYRYGWDPPEAGKAAATALACELFKATPLGGGECALPTGVRRAVRQSVSLDISLFAQWERTPSGAWSVGIPAVDTFLNTYNPNGLRRRPSVFSPWTRRSPRNVGV